MTTSLWNANEGRGVNWAKKRLENFFWEKCIFDTKLVCCKYSGIPCATQMCRLYKCTHAITHRLLATCHSVLYVLPYCVSGRPIVVVAFVQECWGGTTVPPGAHMLLNRQKEWGLYTVVHRDEDGTEEKRPRLVCVFVCVFVSPGQGTDGLSLSSVISLTQA